jgi:hypothetical protein
MKRWIVSLCAVGVLGICWVSLAQGPTKQQELDAAGRATWVPGQEASLEAPFATVTLPAADDAAAKAGALASFQTLQYDSGSVTALPTAFGQIYGNLFNVTSASGTFPAIFSLNSFSFLFAEDSLADTAMFFQIGDASSTAISSYQVRTSVDVPGLVNAGSSFSNPVFNVIPQNALGTTGVFSNGFYLGAWCLNSNSIVPVDNEAIGLDTATFNGAFQGYTGASGAAGTVVAQPQPFNAILRATISGPIPVELMYYEVE